MQRMKSSIIAFVSLLLASSTWAHSPENNHANSNANIIEPSLNGLEKLMHGGVNVHDGGENRDSPVEEKHDFEPSLNGLERKMHGDGDNVHEKKEADETPKEEGHPVIEPSLNGLEKMIHQNGENVHEGDHDHDKEEQTTHKETRKILPGYEGFHGALVHGDESFQHAGNGNEKPTEKAADLDDFKQWQKEQEKTSQLDRFKKLQTEVNKIVGSEKKKREGDFEFRLPEEVINKIGKMEMLSAKEKLNLAIRRMEEAERRKNKKVDL